MTRVGALGRRTRLAVLGSPIAHSKSPALHGAAYRELGLDWTYEAVDVTAAGLPDFLASRDGTWRGVSLTMPLKRDVLPLLATRDDIVDLAGAANTVLLGDEGLAGFNTDVVGITSALRASGITGVLRVRLLGAGATAASVLVAIAQLGATHVLVSTRSPGTAAHLLPLAAMLGLDLAVGPLAGAVAGHRGDPGADPGADPAARPTALFAPDLVVSTLPGGAAIDLEFPADVRRSATLFDVAYDPWPSALATSWYAVDGLVVPGIEMLVGQALSQVRVFVTGSTHTPVEREDAVLAAMRVSVGLAP
ncbi:MAG: shikimate dehydrogenase [Burkholderiaceae bacterium]|nr:shikimate dehydrogenase [Microbacteriaceae bacterium]